MELKQFNELPTSEQEGFILVCMKYGWIQTDFIVHVVESSCADETVQRQVMVEAKANGSRTSYVGAEGTWIGKFESDLLSGVLGDAPDSAGS